ncbi:MAG: hypothetical protein WCT07_03140 [Candidatus Paceibacterota bacterium]
MAKDKNTTGNNKPAAATQRPTLSRDEIDARNKAKLFSLRSECEPLMVDFIKKATRSELESLIAYVNAKTSAGNNMDERMTNTKALALISPEAVAIMTTLPVIDAVMLQSGAQVMNALRSGGDAFDSLVTKYKDFQSKLFEAQNILLPVVDMACENGLVYDRNIIEDYRARKTTETEMIAFKIDPTAPDAHAQLEKAKEAKREEERQVKQLEMAKKAQDKKEREEEQRASEDANKAMKIALGIDLNSPDHGEQLRKVKNEMKKLGIDPKAKDAVKQYQKSEKLTTAAQAAE